MRWRLRRRVRLRLLFASVRDDAGGWRVRRRCARVLVDGDDAMGTRTAGGEVGEEEVSKFAGTGFPSYWRGRRSRGENAFDPAAAGDLYARAMRADDDADDADDVDDGHLYARAIPPRSRLASRFTIGRSDRLSSSSRRRRARTASERSSTPWRSSSGPRRSRSP